MEVPMTYYAEYHKQRLMNWLVFLTCLVILATCTALIWKAWIL